MTRDTTWTLHTETASGTDAIVVSGIDATTPTLRSGSTVSTQLAFYDDGVATREFYERYQALWPFTEINHEAALRTGTTDSGDPWFRERYPASAPVESLLIGVEPGEDIIDGRGWWGLLVSLVDESGPVDETGGLRLYQAEWFVLARFDEFVGHDEVRDEFATEVV